MSLMKAMKTFYVMFLFRNFTPCEGLGVCEQWRQCSAGDKITPSQKDSFINELLKRPLELTFFKNDQKQVIGFAILPIPND